MGNGDVAPSAGAPMRVGLWLAQIVVAAMFVFAGVTKLTTPIPELSAMMPWAGDYSENFVRMIGAIDLAGGIGILLPSLTRIKPRVTIWAASGCVLLQICAIILHISRNEFAVLPLNFVLLACAAFVFWGRSNKAPIVARG